LARGGAPPPEAAYYVPASAPLSSDRLTRPGCPDDSIIGTLRPPKFPLAALSAGAVSAVLVEIERRQMLDGGAEPLGQHVGDDQPMAVTLVALQAEQADTRLPGELSGAGEIGLGLGAVHVRTEDHREIVVAPRLVRLAPLHRRAETPEMDVAHAG